VKAIRAMSVAPDPTAAVAELPVAPSVARPWRRAALWLTLLGPFFYATYGLANWLASLRNGVPSVVFGWEHAIPFIGWTIIPYWSINAFYAVSFFLCRNKQELDTLGRRLFTAQIIAVACFILFPLRFDFVRPEVDGFPGILFAALTSFDQPFNQAPSLHVALLVMLWIFYARLVPGWALWLLHPWSMLVGLSVLTTYQHHFIDIPTGALLGFFCLWLWPDHRPTPLFGLRCTDDRRRVVLAARYGAGAIGLAGLGYWIGGIGLWLFWPAWSLVMVAANYAAVGADGFQKGSDGRVSLASRVLFAPYLAGAWINSRAWTYWSPTPVMIANRVALGRVPDCLTAAKFSSVIDLSAELPGQCRDTPWFAFPMLDLVTPDPQVLRAAAAAIEKARRNGAVLVCCALGYSRSAAAVAVWLVRYGGADSVAGAIECIRTVRPCIVLDEAACNAIATAAQLEPNRSSRHGSA
jgi:membrane-associated phospholipid phosphatase